MPITASTSTSRSTSKPVKHVPKHRGAPSRALPTEAPKRALRTTLVLSSVAVAATGVAVSGGVLSTPGGASATSATGPSVGAADGAADGAAVSQASTGADATASEPSASDGASALTGVSGESSAGLELAARDDRDRDDRAVVSRSSDRRELADPAKEAVLAPAEGPAMTRTEDLSDNDPRTIGRALLAEFGFSSDQFGCLDSLWTKESGWNIYADNPSSSAYGIPQSLPGSKMASAGPDWATNPVTQIRWGLGYIQDRYGSPCSAWGHSQSYNWY